MTNKDKLKQLCNKYTGFDPDNEEDCLNAVKKNGYYIKWIKNPSEEMQLAAVKQWPYFVEYINNPSEKVQLEAVKQNPSSIKYIKIPSIEMQKAATYYSGYDITVITLCPDREEFADEIIANLIIKDIIQ
jgi:NRPS condensation-like uncharacterized protein